VANPTQNAEAQAIIDDQRPDEIKQREKDVLTHVVEDLNAARDARDTQSREAEWEEHHRKYMCELEIGRIPWRSRVYDPEPFAALETVLPRITNPILGAPEVFGVKPTEQGDVAKARKSEILLNYQAERMNLYEKGGEIAKEGFVYGTGIGMVPWRKEYEPRINYFPVLDDFGHPIIDPLTGQPQMKPEKQFVKVFDDPDLERVDIKDMYVDPNATSFRDARFVVHRTTRTRDYLKKKEAEGVYHNIDLIPKADASGDYNRREDIRRTHRKDPEQPEAISLHDESLDLINIHSYYGQYDIDDDGYLEECIIVLANESVVIRVDYNPFPGGFKPFIRYTPIPIPGSFYGMSLFKPIDGITDALNDRTNQIGDANNLTINPMYKVNRFADIDPDQLVSSPGGVVEMNQMTDLEVLDSPSLPGEAFAEIGRLENKIQKALGTYDYAAGGAPQRQEAATTVISLQQVAEIRFKRMAILFERQVIQPLGNMMLKLNKEFMGPQRQVRIVGRPAIEDMQQAQFEKVGQDDIVENADIYAVGAALDPGVNKQQQLEKLERFLAVIAGNPQIMMNPMFGVDLSPIIEAYPYLLDLHKIVKRPVILPINPMLAYQEVQSEEQMADQMLMQQMGAMQAMGQSQMEAEQAQSVPEKTEKNAPSRTKGELAKRKKGGKKSGGKG
jgi:hypothetical protein